MGENIKSNHLGGEQPGILTCLVEIFPNEN